MLLRRRHLKDKSFSPTAQVLNMTGRPLYPPPPLKRKKRYMHNNNNNNNNNIIIIIIINKNIKIKWTENSLYWYKCAWQRPQFTDTAEKNEIYLWGIN